MSLSYTKSEKVRVLSKDQNYINLVDILFPQLLSMTPSGLMWEKDMSGIELERHIVMFEHHLRDALEVANSLDCFLTGLPMEDVKLHGPGPAYSQYLGMFGMISRTRDMRNEWRKVMDVLTLDGSTTAWRKAWGNDVDFTQDWKNFSDAINRSGEYHVA